MMRACVLCALRVPAIFTIWSSYSVADCDVVVSFGERCIYIYICVCVCVCVCVCIYICVYVCVCKACGIRERTQIHNRNRMAFRI